MVGDGVRRGIEGGGGGSFEGGGGVDFLGIVCKSRKEDM